jgi:V/A-type H+-transporting ATPase subunit I
MIVKMKKIYLVVLRKDVVRALESLRDLGTVHVENQNVPFGSELITLREDVKSIDRILQRFFDLKDSGKQEELVDWRTEVEMILGWIKNIERLKDAIQKRKAFINYWEPWGNFDPQAIRELRASGVYIKLYEYNPKEEHEIPEGVALETIFSSGGVERCVAVSDKKFSLPFTEISLPVQSLDRFKQDQENDETQLAELQKNLQEAFKYRDAVKEVLRQLKDDIRFQEVMNGVGSAERLVYLKGFCPRNQTGALQERARQENWAVEIDDPDEDDHVPTLLKNPQWVKLSKPAFDVIEILPGYREVDVSPVFLIFFTLFFGLLIGDAGYGLIFALGTFLAQMKMSPVKRKEPFYLMYLLTGFTIFWGVLTGTYFGQQWISDMIPPLVPWLNDFSNVQWLCFTIALVHLSIARLWSFSLKWPDTTAVAQIGWLLIVWGMYFLANMFVLSQPFPKFAIGFFIAGIPLALFFMFPFNQFLKRIGQEIIPFILSVISSGTDIISYIRLFAVGLATVAVADAANNMAQALSYGMGYVFMIILHILNMILAVMAILVHAVRLNVLEFSGHLGLEWAGVKYNPFSKQFDKSLKLKEA